MPGQDGEHIEVIGKFPVHTVSAYFGTQIRRVHQEHHIRDVLVLCEYLLVVTRNNGDAFEVVRYRWIVRFTNIIVKSLLLHFGNAQFVLHTEHQG